MATNLERFKNDLDRLIRQGELLKYSMIKELSAGDGFSKQLREVFGERQADKLMKEIPNFITTYEAWYSESLALLQQLLPYRVSNFVGLYEKPKGRKSIAYDSYVIQDYLQDLIVKRGGDVIVAPKAALNQYEQQLAIVKAAKTRFKSSLFEIRQLVQADLFDCEIDAARELLKNKFIRAAGAIVGVVLEKHLRQVCDDHTIKVTKKHPGIADLNELLKSNAVIDIPRWRHVSMLADLRNLCDHNKFKEPTAEQVADLIDGAEKAIKTIA
jgi:hypothetical protein